MNKREKSFLMAAVAGISMGLATPASTVAEEAKGDVKCWGINGCGAHAKCAVAEGDLKALRQLLGNKDYKARFGKSETHACGAHAKCGASSSILNWVPATLEKCKADGGYIVDEVGTPKKKVAKKA